MTPEALLARLRVVDVEVKLEGEKLKCSVPKGALDNELLATIKQLKPQIVALLSGPPESTSDETFSMKVYTWPEELREQWEERAAIMEYDGGLTRKEAEFLAYERIKSKQSELFQTEEKSGHSQPSRIDQLSLKGVR